MDSDAARVRTAQVYAGGKVGQASQVLHYELPE
jgi:hypothetical protein